MKDSKSAAKTIHPHWRVVGAEIHQRPGVVVEKDGTLTVIRDGQYLITLHDPRTNEYIKRALISPVLPPDSPINGKRSDGATIPFLARWILPKWNATNGAVPHDDICAARDAWRDLGIKNTVVGYQFGDGGVIADELVLNPAECSREQGDYIFYYIILIQEPIAEWRAKAGLLGVRAGSWHSYNLHHNGSPWRFSVKRPYR